jgi:hypothetical protein
MTIALGADQKKRMRRLSFRSGTKDGTNLIHDESLGIASECREQPAEEVKAEHGRRTDWVNAPEQVGEIPDAFSGDDESISEVGATEWTLSSWYERPFVNST